ncbi:MAG: phosphatidylglycerophosphatase A [Spirochaetota bacterium]
MWWKELFFTGLYSGYSRFAPGTAGTILAALIYIFEHIVFGYLDQTVNLIVVLVLMYPSIKACDAGEKFFNTKDPSEIVLDEMMGYWVSVLFFPFNIKIVILAFIIFRILDIFKPYPINKMEKLKGGLGIMMDDVISGVYANLIIRIIILFAGMFIQI